MKYILDRQNYHRFDVMAINKLPRRSYFIPFSTRKRAAAAVTEEKRYSSDKVRCLSGEWDFRFYPRPAELPEVLDTDAVAQHSTGEMAEMAKEAIEKDLKR